MKNILGKITPWFKAHKKTGIAGMVLLVGIFGYAGAKIIGDDGIGTRYVLAAAERGTIIASITGSGQVSASDQVELSAKASGELLSLNVKVGQEVGAGSVIAQIDSGDAYYDLETAKLNYDKLVTTDPDTLKDNENAVTDAKDDLEDVYINARTSLSSLSSGMSDVLEDLEPLFNCNTGFLSSCLNYSESNTHKEYLNKAGSSWYEADDILYEFGKIYKTISITSTKEEIDVAVSKAYDATVAVAEAAKYTKDAIVYFRDHAATDSEKAEAVEAYTTVTGPLLSANSLVSEVTSTRNSITTAKRALDKANTDLSDLREGPDTLDLRSSQLTLSQKQAALSDYSVRAPFAGIIASVSAKRGDSVNSGTAIATLITEKKIAEISLNEIDVARVAVGQKATLTFDAFEDLTITGEIAEVDLVGTVSQGVVNYKVKVAFDTDDDKVRPGMTANASIITDMKQNIVMVPASAVKMQGGISYVEVVDGDNSQNLTNQSAGVVLATLPRRVEVTTGFTNDESIEIISGLEEGQQYVARTITTTTGAQSTQSAPSLLGGGTGGARPTGGGGFGGGGGNFPR